MTRITSTPQQKIREFMHTMTSTILEVEVKPNPVMDDYTRALEVAAEIDDQHTRSQMTRMARRIRDLTARLDKVKRVYDGAVPMLQGAAKQIEANEPIDRQG